MTKAVLLGLALLLGACVPAPAQEPGPAPPGPPTQEDERLTGILDRVAEAVARYHSELFRIAFTETLRREELRKDMTPKKTKEFVFDSVVLREALSDDEEDYYPRTIRRIRTVDGKPTKRAAGKEGAAGVAVSSLAFLLPKNRHLYRISLDGEEQVEGRRAHRIRMLREGEEQPRVEWRGRLVGLRFYVFAPEVRLVWVDAENYDVLRVEAHLVEPFEFDSPRAFSAGPFGRFGPSRRLKLLKRDYAAQFRRVQFKDPEQALLVPVSAEFLYVLEGASQPRLRHTLRFSDYRRFRSDVKVLEDEEPGQ